MAIQTVSQIKAWFRRRMYPTQEQFSDLFDSYWNKLELIAMTKVDGLMAALNLKQDKAADIVVDASKLESYDPTKIEGYQAGNVFVSYQNAFSTNPDEDFKKLFIYQCVADALQGQSPETNPECWTRIGETMTYTSATTCNSYVVYKSELFTLIGVRDRDTVAVMVDNAVYKYNKASNTWPFFCELKPVVVQVPGTSTTAVMSQKAVTDLVAAASGGGSGLASTWEPNIAAIRALTSHNTGNDVGDYATLNIYEYDATLTNAEDVDNTYLKPDNVTGAGRWVKRKQLALKSEMSSVSFSITGGMNEIPFYPKNAQTFNSVTKDASITDLRVGKNGASPTTISFPYSVLITDRLVFSLTYDQNLNVAFTLR